MANRYAHKNTKMAKTTESQRAPVDAEPVHSVSTTEPSTSVEESDFSCPSSPDNDGFGTYCQTDTVYISNMSFKEGKNAKI